MPQDANEQKYATEHAFLQYSDGCALFPCSELYKMTTDNLDPHYYNNSHIYFIGQHSNVRFLASKKVPLDSFEITYEIDAENNSQKRAGVSKFINCQNVLEITTIDNGKTCQIITNDRKNPRIVPFLQLLLFLETPPLEFLNVKVLYIGQAFGDGKGKKHRTAIERLKAHSTLQEILIKESEKKWLNTCLLFFTYTKPYRFILKMDGRGKPIIAGDEDLDHSKSVRENPPTTKQRISIIEASLIRYFQPHYNTHYVHEYPTPTNKHLADAYRYDYNAIISEIDTEDIRFRLFSDIVTPATHHIAQFDLYSIEERKSFSNCAL